MVSLTLKSAGSTIETNSADRRFADVRFIDEPAMDQAPSAPTHAGEHDLVSLSILWRALRVVLMIATAAAGGAALVAWIVLGSKLSAGSAILGFCVAFLMIMFIGMPLMLASIQDAIEEH